MNEQQREYVEIAHKWLDAWNRHDLDAIMTHYSDEVIFASPFVKSLLDNEQGTIVGKDALRKYFETALRNFPDLHFTLDNVMTGANSLVVTYRLSVADVEAAEWMRLDDRGLVQQVQTVHRQTVDS
eukprot:TRINITY_DN588_c0_g1_i2.p2 TRINITY_DN588_c0_g1~~TRINITY_DN588_c0_g1_i2.p2  ORF type:complete len:126 (+),score=21.99 TRINITY_DN588_c0_g1_i2:250-627(+)